MINLQPHQQRLVEEKTELDLKLEKLVAFLWTPMMEAQGKPRFDTLDLAEQTRLLAQLFTMRQYARILAERIAAFMGSPGLTRSI